MANSKRRDMRPSEYGGRPGLIQRPEDGHEMIPHEVIGRLAREDGDHRSLTSHADYIGRFERQQ